MFISDSPCVPIRISLANAIPVGSLKGGIDDEGIPELLDHGREERAGSDYIEEGERSWWHG